MLEIRQTNMSVGDRSVSQTPKHCISTLVRLGGVILQRLIIILSFTVTSNLAVELQSNSGM